VITLASRHSHRDVFVGASIGLALATGVSVGLGYAADSLLGPYLRLVVAIGGALLIGFGVRELLRAPTPPREPAPNDPKHANDPRRIVMIALGLAFLLEMGDNTQVLAIVLVATTGSVLLVYLAATAGLLAVTALSAQAASSLARRIPEERLRVVLGASLLAVGAITVVAAAAPGILP
jgi:putative Ca2+/H+ antiporter (TMEM165/GDT1 family)